MNKHQKYFCAHVCHAIKLLHSDSFLVTNFQSLFLRFHNCESHQYAISQLKSFQIGQAPRQSSFSIKLKSQNISDLKL